MQVTVKGEGLLANTYLEPEKPSLPQEKQPDAELENKVRKLKKKLAQKDDKVKELEKDLKKLEQDFKGLALLKDEEIKEVQQKLNVSKEELSDQHLKIKQIEFEKNLILTQQSKQIEATDASISQDLL